METLRYSRDDLMRSHPYARPHEAAGYRLHGGFTQDGAYVSPRTLVRWPAVRAWGEALKARGWPLIDATGELLAGDGYPSFEQHKLLLKEGLGQGLWNSLTITGIIEARGQGLCNITAPDIGALVVDDVTDTASGHLNAGLLYAHGADEGGDPAKPGEGAHDAMWFAARDLVFGKGAYPIPEAPASISRDVDGREMPQIPEGYEQLIKFLMNVLMIEIRAESFFALCVRLFRDGELFTDRRAEADTAATMVERIRTDEAVHVGYLQVVISELRSFIWKIAGGEIPGAAIIDPVWARMVEWHGKTEREIARARSRANVEAQVVAARGAAPARGLLARFDALDARVAA
ncbi:MAG TPA: hypothetical protein VII73_00785 [Caulobacteraceae bacterium]